MDAADQLHVVLGATGGAGGALVSELAGDAADAAQTRTACQGATVVHHCVQPPYQRWAAEFPTLTQGIADTAAAAGARLVDADNPYAYGPVDGPSPRTCPRWRPPARAGSARSWPSGCSARPPPADEPAGWAAWTCRTA
jgi:hypothetical protein